VLDPELGGSALFVAKAIRHPLLDHEIAVPNNVSLGCERQYLLVSGSNMAGKSTLLRAMGANVVLALAGAPVAAQLLRMNVVRLGASIAVNDSLSEGKSRFLAEVERLKGIVTTAREHRGAAMFLIDEILAGTNSADRKTAAESVVRSLLDAGAIGAISTHDLTLAQIAEETVDGGENVHMASKDADDPLAFDYKLAPGMNRITNAIAIVRMMGLE
jgi:DNA mismatch repair ATPase MutS